MKVYSIFLIFLFSILCACTGLQADDDGGGVDDTREGDIDLDLDLDLSDKGCKLETSVPGNEIDLLADLFNVKYEPRQARECLQKKLQDNHIKICDTRLKLERRRDNARTEAERERVENAIDKLDEMEFKYNQRLYALAARLDNKLKADEKKRRSKTLLSRAGRYFFSQETEALRDIFEVESYAQCSSYSSDDDDNDNYRS